MNEKILIIEDESGIAFMVGDRLRSEGYTVEHQDNGLAGEKCALENSFDLILLDVMLPGKDGFQICQDLRKKELTTPIIMLTARSTNIDTVMGLRLGADDYLPKPFDMSVLLARIEALLRRSHSNSTVDNKPVAPNQVHFGDFCLDTESQELRRGNDVITLNAQEYRLLNFLVHNPHRVLSRDELLDAVWGYNSDVTTRTVDVHVAWLRKKLDDHPVARYLLTLRGRGYKFVPDP